VTVSKGFYGWLYKGGRPNRLARLLNRSWAAIHALGIIPNYLVTLDVRGRRSGRMISLPLVMALVEGERYLVSMLGENVDWVRNVRAAGGAAVLRHGRREEVQLVEVAVEQRAPIIKAYVKRAPGGRPHIPVDKNAPVSDFERVAGEIPVFRVVTRSG
jgi:deazaflavin-dependent oxidoreductase (nitroreductase family)